jgi:hypothetical protein
MTLNAQSVSRPHPLSVDQSSIQPLQFAGVRSFPSQNCLPHRNFLAAARFVTLRPSSGSSSGSGSGSGSSSSSSSGSTITDPAMSTCGASGNPPASGNLSGCLHSDLCLVLAVPGKMVSSVRWHGTMMFPQSRVAVKDTSNRGCGLFAKMMGYDTHLSGHSPREYCMYGRSTNVSQMQVVTS